jgi:hypothetical protein
MVFLILLAFSGNLTAYPFPLEEKNLFTFHMETFIYPLFMRSSWFDQI